MGSGIPTTESQQSLAGMCWNVINSELHVACHTPTTVDIVEQLVELQVIIYNAGVVKVGVV
jgi:hypothetical protein